MPIIWAVLSARVVERITRGDEQKGTNPTIQNVLLALGRGDQTQVGNVEYIPPAGGLYKHRILQVFHSVGRDFPSGILQPPKTALLRCFRH